jgi:hypothetical protein
MIIAPRPDFKWDEGCDAFDNVAALLQLMNEATDKYGDCVYDYYSMAHWVLIYKAGL